MGLGVHGLGAAAVAAATSVGVKEFNVASVPGSVTLWEVYGKMENPCVFARSHISKWGLFSL